MEDNEIIICSKCYEENKKGDKKCKNCGSTLYYNSEAELEETDDDVIFFDEDNFDSSIKCIDYIVAVDKENEELSIFYKLKIVKTIPFDTILECKIVENSNVLNSGGVGRAIVGGMLSGGVGAIVGANTRKSKNMLNNFLITIITNDIDEPQYTMNLVKTPINVSSSIGSVAYKSLIECSNKIYALIQSILSNNTNTENKNYNGLEQLEKLAELKDKGIITEQEFEESKKKILSKL